MQFTGITSRHTARNMLQKYAQDQTGKGRYTKYRLKFDYKTDFDYLSHSFNRSRGS
ncbi:hypothetical protein J2R98_002921 [Alkalibacillus filiformis]|uniref:Uncharacterized protein n=1 Tax=Alkalibacillus filiformis TaxID=200990 RepID=A0ABU0DXF9_9BACI|nr:hypothetical protein [Alkalibacillus filiformis]